MSAFTVAMPHDPHHSPVKSGGILVVKKHCKISLLPTLFVIFLLVTISKYVSGVIEMGKAFGIFLVACVLTLSLSTGSALAAQYDIAAAKGLSTPPVWTVFSEGQGASVQRYAVWGGSSAPDGSGLTGYTLLGYATGTATFTGTYDYYAVSTASGYTALVDSIQGSDGAYIDGSNLEESSNTYMDSNAFGAPDQKFAVVGGQNNGDGYIAFSSPGGLTGITVIAPVNLFSVLKKGWSLHERDGYVLETEYFYNPGNTSWTATTTYVWKVGASTISHVAVINNGTAALIEPLNGIYTMKRFLEPGGSDCKTNGKLSYCHSLGEGQASVPHSGGTETGCLPHSTLIYGQGLAAPMVKTEVYCGGKMMQKSDDQKTLDSNGELVKYTFEDYFVTDSGTTLSGAPFYSAMDTANTNFDALKSQFPTREMQSLTKTVVIPLL